VVPSRSGFVEIRLTFSAVLLWIVALTFGCGGSSDSSTRTACAPGRSVACSGERGCAGHQVCRDDGAGYEPCVCSSDETFPSKGPKSGFPGATCEDDGDCRTGLLCLTSGSTSLKGEGPSGGLCLAECASDHSSCEDSYSGTLCVVLDGGRTDETIDDDAFCLPTCELGQASSNAQKCLGRADLVCAEKTAGSGVGYCRPACRSDVDCRDRFCNLATGLCTDKAPVGDGIGAACNPAAPTCAGGCIQHGATYAECSGVCRLETAGCGQAPAREPPYDFWCYLDPSQVGAEGDLGYCTRTCDCDDDCGRDDAVCMAEDALQSQIGRRGVCASKSYASGGARPGISCD
jgi:hypothetical protein